ncbi:MAG TPA: hypothetical protein VJ386_03940 [Candidatus Deferrimicrobiaceae bacterium]|nr:hypothetical protein [Candidatus Deferrimicrobiaceae bacterium]
MPTISVTMVPEITRKVRVPRAVHVRFPLGHPFGFPGQAFLQRRILSHMIYHAGAIEEPGTIVDLGVGGTSAAECAVCPPVPGE